MKRRRIVRWIRNLGLILLIGLGTLPWWFPWVMGWVLGGFGIEYSATARLGWGRFAVTGLRYEDENIEVEVGEIAGYHPLSWLYRLRFPDGGDAGPRAFVEVRDWEVDIRESDVVSPGEQSRRIDSTADVLEQVVEWTRRVESWMPAAKLANGLVRWRNREIRVPEIRWRDGRVIVHAADIGHDLSARLRAEVDSDRGLTLQARLEPEPMGFRMTARPLTEGWAVNGELLWRSNRMALKAGFGSSDWFPESAELLGRSLRFPVREYGVEPYAALEGDLDVNFTNRQVRFDMNMSTRSESEKIAPPVAMEIHGTADMDKISLGELNIQSPALSAALDSPLVVNLGNRRLAGPARLTATADLSRQPWLPVNGWGDIEVFFRQPGEDTWPEAAFSIQTGSIGYDETVILEDLAAEGALQWPQLNVTNLAVHLPGESRITGSAGLQLTEERILSGSLKASLYRLAVSPWLPEEWKFNQAQFQVSFDGPLSAPNYRGHASIEGFRHPATSLWDSELDWRAEGGRPQEIEWTIRSGDSRFAMEAGMPRWDRVEIADIVLSSNRTEVLKLKEPAVITLERPEKEDPSSAPAIRFSAITLVDAEGEERLRFSGETAWPVRGQAVVSLGKMDPDLFRDFLAAVPVRVTVVGMEADVEWDAGPATWALDFEGVPHGDGGWNLTTSARISGNADGIRVEAMQLLHDSNPLLSVHGRLPLTFHPATPESPLQFDPQSEWQGVVQWHDDVQLWQQISNRIPVHLPGISGELKWSGTAQNPKADLRMTADRVEAASAAAPLHSLPSMSGVEARVHLTPEQLTLERAEVKVNEYPVVLTASATIPPALRKWESLRTPKQAFMTLAENASGRLHMPEAPVTILGPAGSARLRESGTLAADVNLEPGFDLRGKVSVNGLATQHLAPLGSLQDINGIVRFQGKEIHLENLQAELGRRRISVDGYVRTTAGDFRQGAMPEFEFHLRGTKVPLIRRRGLILRSDLDLTFTRTEEGKPVLRGSVHPKDSFVLSELDPQLFLGNVKTPELRPPFFSVEQEPFSEWQLEVEIIGEDFLHVRSPVFQGKISSHLRLRGDLGDPLLLGDIVCNEGVFLFPFSNLPVTRGVVTFSEENPHDPSLAVNASARVYGYDVAMQVEGSLNDPVITFSSNPPLTSEEILLMITAGEIPRREIGLTSGQKVGKLAMFLGRDLLNRISGNEAAEERLIIRSGDDISTSGKATYYVEYKLTDRWSLVGEYDEYSAFNAGVKWRLIGR